MDRQTQPQSTEVPDWLVTLLPRLHAPSGEALRGFVQLWPFVCEFTLSAFFLLKRQDTGSLEASLPLPGSIASKIHLFHLCHGCDSMQLTRSKALLSHWSPFGDFGPHGDQNLFFGPHFFSKSPFSPF